MDLWIRSQDKQIFKQSNYLKIEIHNQNEYCIVEQATIYGKYNTKEKALEIIDDIQRNLVNPYRDLMIYEMPSE